MHQGPPAEAAPPPSSARPPPLPRPKRRYGRALLQTALGLLVGLGITEAAFRHRDHDAYPLVNVYEPDARRGVRLAPNTTTRIGSATTRATEVRINRDGARGADWPAPAPNDVLVIGDSLSFGLGVEEHETLRARLHEALPGGPAVLDASVPTYGPPEYLVTMEQHLSTRRPGTVVVVVNLINDLAEIDAPNTARHTALDGFAARVDPGAPKRASSRIRTRAIQRSHAAFALWKWVRERESENTSLPPEEGASLLLPLAMRVAAESRTLDDHRRDEARRASAVMAAEIDVRDAERNVVRLVRENRGLVARTGIVARKWEAYLRADGRPGDALFENDYGGCAPPPRHRGRGRYRYPSLVRFEGSRIQRDVERLLQDMARGLQPERRKPIEEAFAWRARARERVASAPTDPLPPPPPTAPLPTATFFAQMGALASAYGSKLAIVVAPLDAQVSPEARQRRAIDEVEGRALDVLTAEMARAAAAVGAVGVDATPVLQEAGEGAFLHDGHLSPRGHDLVARAIARAIAPSGGGAG